MGYIHFSYWKPAHHKPDYWIVDWISDQFAGRSTKAGNPMGANTNRVGRWHKIPLDLDLGIG